jgi:hypothetical protein
MSYTLSKTAPSKGDPTAKNRVWDFFGEPSNPRPKNRAQPQQPRRKNRPCAYKTASGIPYWPSWDPIEERGGMNLYEFAGNDALLYIDNIGLSIPPIIPRKALFHCTCTVSQVYDCRCPITDKIGPPGCPSSLGYQSTRERSDEDKLKAMWKAWKSAQAANLKMAQKHCGSCNAEDNPFMVDPPKKGIPLIPQDDCKCDYY